MKLKEFEMKISKNKVNLALERYVRQLSVSERPIDSKIAERINERAGIRSKFVAKWPQSGGEGPENNWITSGKQSGRQRTVSTSRKFRKFALLSATGGSDGPSKSYAARRRGGDPRRLTLAPADKPGYRPRPSKHFMSVFKGGR